MKSASNFTSVAFFLHIILILHLKRKSTSGLNIIVPLLPYMNTHLTRKPHHPPPFACREKMHDKRLLTCISVMMGLDVIGPDDDVDMDAAADTTPSTASPKNTPPPRAPPKEEKMDVDKTPTQINVGRESESCIELHRNTDRTGPVVRTRRSGPKSKW